ncbi:pirin family protein [Porifericola rhodea]|uniref:pirin family protein n=1 Tax=Porifericola rhodea TaxID=930972 RepID=UPI0026660EE8|nr:pirin-like bicupin family protein [Porifericola rhodea]WKN31240.1 pirin family protein [Porifericola rhodea]
MKTILHQSNNRGHSNFGWLDSYHSFSFGRYYDPQRMGFGVLRVLNDDHVTGGAGFGTHPHDNMEIVSIPLWGNMAHKDSTGTNGVIKTGDVQIMSAGSGITHSEFNLSKDKDLKFLQIWVMPKERNIKPRYAQQSYDLNYNLNQWQTVVAPDEEQALWINQDAYFTMIKTDRVLQTSYRLKQAANGVYLFVIEGMLKVKEHQLKQRDALGVYEAEEVEMEISKDAYILAIEVPMG